MDYALIFDVDGVVADTETLNARASVLMFQQLYDVTVQPEDFLPFVGHGDERYVQGVAEKYGVSLDLEAAVQRRAENFFALLDDEPLPASPGLLELVQAARQAPNARLAIATSGRRDKQFPVIEGTGLRLNWFDVVITGGDVTRKKPDPQIYQITGERLGVPPGRCVVFEDAPAGVQAAKAAGMTCVGLVGTVGAKDLAAADRVVTSLAELTLCDIAHLAGIC
jgi:beta-phosphoglucomutase